MAAPPPGNEPGLEARLIRAWPWALLGGSVLPALIALLIAALAPDAPSAEEEKRLRDPAHQGRIATAILDGVRNWFHANPPPGTWIAANRKPPREHLKSKAGEGSDRRLWECTPSECQPKSNTVAACLPQVATDRL